MLVFLYFLLSVRIERADLEWVCVFELYRGFDDVA